MRDAKEIVDTVRWGRAILPRGDGVRPRRRWVRAASLVTHAVDDDVPAIAEEQGKSPQVTRSVEDESAAPVARCPPLASSPSGLLGTLPAQGGGRGHLGVGFALRCVQRFSGPDVATRRCPWQNSLRTSGPSAPVLSY